MMKQTLIFLLAGVLPAAAQIPAFPGAQGFGAYATGGRGGDVYYVTNLNASGVGSLRYGVDNAPASGRTIVFAVSGYISISGGSLRLVQNKITIAGQTAPGDGIGLRNGTLRVTGNNTILRNLRIRHGKSGSGGDCLNVDSAATNSIIDHVTMQFSTDENISFFSSALDNFTMQNSVTAWGLETHNAGGLWDLNRGSCINSLWAHHHTRNPKARPYGLLEWINNVTYDWGIGFIMGDSETPAAWKANVRSCYFLSPPGRTDNTALEKGTIDRNGYPNFSLYLDNCLHDSDGNGQLNGTNKGYGIVGGSEYNPAEGAVAGANRYLKPSVPFPGSSGAVMVQIADALTAYKKVVSNSGAVRLDANYSGAIRDEVDTILFNNVTTQATSRISSESALAAAPFNVSNAGFGTLNSISAPIDTDQDGMPDIWEQALGFNAALASHNTVFANNGSVITAATFFPANTQAGYTHLEEYLHFLSVPHATVAKSLADTPSSLTVDLRKFTAGFSKSPIFTVSNLSGGTITQFAANGTTLASGGPIIRFSPTVNTSGRAGFSFTVLDADGSSWTRQFAVLVSNSSVPRDLHWQGGTASNVWDATAINWRKSSGEAIAFSDGDTTVFDDRGLNSPAVSLTGTLVPGSVLVSGTKNYSFAGTGSITSTGSFTKEGDTAFTLSRTASFSAGSNLSGGTTNLSTGGSLAGGPIRFTGGSTLRSNYGSNDTLTLSPNIIVNAGAVGNLTLSPRVNLNGSLSGGGTFNIFSPSTLGTEGRVYLDGASAGCTGFVNLSGGGSGRIAFRTNGGAFNGFNSARVHLSGITVYTTNNSSGNTHAIGSLSGEANSIFAGAYNAGAGQTTLNIGGLGLDSVFAGVIRDGSAAATAVTKSGVGKLTLSGANTYTGATAVSAGTLEVSGSLGASPVTVASGASLIGQGSFGGLISVNGGGKINPGNAESIYQNLPANGGLSVAGGTLIYDLSSSPTGVNDKITVAAGKVTTLSGTINFQLNFRDGVLGAGTYQLIGGGATQGVVSGMVMNPLLPAPAGTFRQSFSLVRPSSGSTPGYVNLVVSGNVGNLTWTGANGGVWDLNTTLNNWSGASPNGFRNLDLVTFSDGAVTGGVTLSGSLEPARVSATNVTQSFSLVGDGFIAGAGRLIKEGAGVFSVGNTTANTFTGGTTINSGTLALANATGLLGSGPIAMNGGTLRLPNAGTYLSNSMVFTGSSAISSLYSGNSTIVNSTSERFSSVGNAAVSLSGLSGILSINGRMDEFSGSLLFGSSSGMLRLNSNTSDTADVNRGSAYALFDLGNASGKLVNRNGNGTFELGGLAGGPNTNLGGRQSGSGSTTSIYRIGALNTSTNFAGSITSNGDLSGLDLVKVGTGNLSLSGISSFSGSVMVESGKLTVSGRTFLSGNYEVAAGATLSLVDGSIGAEVVTVDGFLSGQGTVEADLNCTGVASGRGAETGGAGVLRVNGSAFFNPSSVIRLRVGGGSDQISVRDDLDLSGALEPVLASDAKFGRFTIFTHGGTLKMDDFTLVPPSGGGAMHLSTSVAGQVALVVNDSDEDLLPDTWEMQFFGNLNSMANDDVDGDGQSNAFEWLVGTNPSSGTSRFAATIAQRSASEFSLTWPSVPGRSYTIQSSQSLAGAWQNLAFVSGAADPAKFTSHTIGKTSGVMFYRVALDP